MQRLEEVRLIRMCKSNIIKFLNESLNEKLFVSIFSDREQPDKCSVGFVEAISEDHVLINHVTTLGIYK